MSINQSSVFTSSPSSLNNLESQHDTPQTKSSTFSPEALCCKGTPNVVGGKQGIMPPVFTLQRIPVQTGHEFPLSQNTVAASQDPFISSKTTTLQNRTVGEGPKLSPTAISFTPLPRKADKFSAVGQLVAESSPDDLITSAKIQTCSVPVLTRANVSSSGQQTPPSPISPISSDSSFNSGRSSLSLGSSRYLLVCGISQAESQQTISRFFDARLYPTLKQLLYIDLASAGIIYVGFADLRDANKAYSTILSTNGTWRARFISAQEYASKQRPEDDLPVALHEGRVVVIATYTGPPHRFDAACIGHLVKELLENYGDLVRYDVIHISPPNVTLCAEYFSSASARLAVSSLDAFKIAACILTIYHNGLESAADLSQRVGVTGPIIIGQEDHDLDHALGQFHLEACSHSNIQTTMMVPPMIYERKVPLKAPVAPMGSHRSMSAQQYIPSYVQQTIFTPGVVGQERSIRRTPGHSNGLPSHAYRNNSPKVESGPKSDYGSSHHNAVDIERIRQGTDVRTTIMLRNIPNKIDQAMLKEIVDETSLGKYDFMYLRIDFANNCNVGYAFINFEDVGDRPLSPQEQGTVGIVTTVIRLQKYLMLVPIQGKDCLVQKFRNSSVMLEHPSFRPKIFLTGIDSNAGEEDVFPGADNPSKMRRSIENAEHVGLFAPRAGQHFRDEQRRRRSQYDRGTRFAELEEGNVTEDFDQYEQFDYQRISAAAPLNGAISIPLLR
ncbi:hypothetical protein MMC09_002371 [Bachmanniomyces sp. S44760]|nr:hypothetical protein [Bachmanniomyces sp. S44760]